MQTLTNMEVYSVSGGCEEHCWGDFEVGDLGANMIGGAVTGIPGGPAGIAAGFVGGAVVYLLGVMWTDD